MDKKSRISRSNAPPRIRGRHGYNCRGQPASAPGFRFDYARLIEEGFAGLACGMADLMVTLRGTGMIDVFDRRYWWHVAFLDFDLQREIHLDSAFGSPLIGLPFSAAFRQSQGVDLAGFDDLRRQHHYGFFVETDYRNKGDRGIWNLDEFMMAIALEKAEAEGHTWFSIKPTGDTAPYYIRKFGAVRPMTTKTESVLHIPLGSARGSLPHVHPVAYNNQTRFLSLACSADPAWQHD